MSVHQLGVGYRRGGRGDRRTALGGEPLVGNGFEELADSADVGGPLSAAARLRVGDLLRIVPNHACGTINMFSGAYAVEGDRAVERDPPLTPENAGPRLRRR